MINISFEEYEREMKEAFEEGMDAYGLYEWAESYTKRYLDEIREEQKS